MFPGGYVQRLYSLFMIFCASTLYDTAKDPPTYPPTERERERERDRKTDRQTDRQAGRQTDRIYTSVTVTLSPATKLIIVSHLSLNCHQSINLFREIYKRNGRGTGGIAYSTANIRLVVSNPSTVRVASGCRDTSSEAKENQDQFPNPKNIQIRTTQQI